MIQPQTTPGKDKPPKVIRIAAAIITDERGRVLLVRKQGSRFFIQPGGKIEPGETSLEALGRELNEELGCVATRVESFGQFSAPAVNEPGFTVEADLYRVEVAGPITPGAEIAEIAWVDPAEPGDIVAAPLTRDYILTPLLRRGG